MIYVGIGSLTVSGDARVILADNNRITIANHNLSVNSFWCFLTIDRKNIYWYLPPKAFSDNETEKAMKYLECLANNGKEAPTLSSTKT